MEPSHRTAAVSVCRRIEREANASKPPSCGQGTAENLSCPSTPSLNSLALQPPSLSPRACLRPCSALDLARSPRRLSCAHSRGCQGPRPELRLPANDLTGIGRYRPGISVNLGPHSLRARRNPVPAAVGLAEVGRSGGMAGEHDVPSPRSRASRPASSLASAHSPVSPHAAGQQQPVRMDGLIKVCSELVNGMMHRLLPESEPSWQCIDRADAVAGVRSKGE